MGMNGASRLAAACCSAALWLCFVADRTGFGGQPLPDRAVNIILFIGDGMGREQVRAAHCWLGSNLCFETWMYSGALATASADSPVTDSAAAATAIATGTKVNNGVVSVALPGDGRDLRTVLEYYKSRGKRTGLVTTSYMTDATPAAFAAHVSTRSDLNGIAADYLQQVRPNVLFGGGLQGLTTADAEAANYVVVSNRDQMMGLDPTAMTNVSGQFGSGSLPYEYDGMGDLPHLSQMTATALSILTHSPSGFFLMVEGGKIDHACHGNDIARAVPEVVEFDTAVKVVAAWAASRTDTLVVVAADHETGGLTVLQDNGPGNLPDVSWSTTGHTDRNVGIWATGAGSSRVSGIMSNTFVYDVLMDASLVPAVCRSITNNADANQTWMEWTVATGEVYRLECGSNLMQSSWTPLNVVTSASATATFTHSNAAANSVFYRLLALPE